MVNSFGFGSEILIVPVAYCLSTDLRDIMRASILVTCRKALISAIHRFAIVIFVFSGPALSFPALAANSPMLQWRGKFMS